MRGFTDKFDVSSSLITFADALTGLNLVGIHFGGGARDSTNQKVFLSGTGGGTAWYLLDFGGVGSNSMSLNLSSASSVALISTIPEPEIYAMMAVGLGLLGFMARRKSKPA